MQITNTFKEIPMHKGERGVDSAVETYKLISLLSTFSKIIENLVIKQLLHFPLLHRNNAPQSY